MAENIDPEEDRKPDPQEGAPRPPRKADGNDLRDTDPDPEQEHISQDDDSADPETGQ